MDKNLEYLLQQFTDRIQVLSEAAARRGCTSFEEYQYVCGQIRGLEAACAVVTDLRERLETMDD